MKTGFSFLCFLILGGCVDRLQYEIQKGFSYAISVDGYISNLPGPYHVYLNRSFDIESKETTKVPVSAREVTLMSDQGESEALTELSSGHYATDPNGIRGNFGHAYMLRIELRDGSVYESIPDTLLSTGSIDSVYYQFTSDPGLKSIYTQSPYGFDIYANTSKPEHTSNRYMWKLTSTFKAQTHPGPGNLCYWTDDKCNFAPPCSGIKNVGTTANPRYIQAGPCTCCTCWYGIFNDRVLLSDDYYTLPKQESGNKIGRVPLGYWIFRDKVHVDVSLRSLTENTFRFWKSVRDQEDAIGSLFQPITGHIPNGFIQISGPTTPLLGIFFATGISSRSMYVYKEDIPDSNLIPLPPPNGGPDGNPCTEAFPNSTTVRPDYWID